MQSEASNAPFRRFDAYAPWNIGNYTKDAAGDKHAAAHTWVGGRFLWEQLQTLSNLGVEPVYVAMFDEVDEGTALFKVTNKPPVEGHFVGYEGLPSDWYLRLVGEGGRRLRQGQPVLAEIPIELLRESD